jgi:hypothetical protein
MVDYLLIQTRFGEESVQSTGKSALQLKVSQTAPSMSSR